MSRRTKISKEMLAKEEEKLAALEKKTERQRIYVADIKQQLMIREFSEAESILSAKGLSIKEILSAVERGDFTVFSAAENPVADKD